LSLTAALVGPLCGEWGIPSVCTVSRESIFRLSGNHSVIQSRAMEYTSLVKVDLKTLESNWNWKNYLADSRCVALIDLLTFPPIIGVPPIIGGTFSSAFKMVASQRVALGKVRLDTFLSRPQAQDRSSKKASLLVLGTIMVGDLILHFQSVQRYDPGQGMQGHACTSLLCCTLTVTQCYINTYNTIHIMTRDRVRVET
jgi:hypothetical protein